MNNDNTYYGCKAVGVQTTPHFPLRCKVIMKFLCSESCSTISFDQENVYYMFFLCYGILANILSFPFCPLNITTRTVLIYNTSTQNIRRYNTQNIQFRNALGEQTTDTSCHTLFFASTLRTCMVYFCERYPTHSHREEEREREYVRMLTVWG